MLGTAVWLATASQGFDTADRRFALVVSLSFYPVLENLTGGNNALFSLLVFTLIYLALKRERDGLAGALLAVELLKPQLAIALLVVLIWKRRWRAVVGFGGVSALWAILSVWLVAPESLLSYLGTLPTLSRLAFVGGYPFALFSSVYAIFQIPLGPSGFAAATLLGSACAIALVGFLLVAWRGAWRPETDQVRSAIRPHVSGHLLDRPVRLASQPVGLDPERHPPGRPGAQRGLDRKLGYDAPCAGARLGGLLGGSGAHGVHPRTGRYRRRYSPSPGRSWLSLRRFQHAEKAAYAASLPAP